MFHVYWPALTALTMFVLGAILLILRFGDRLCRARHNTLPSEEEWDDKVYDQKVSFA